MITRDQFVFRVTNEAKKGVDKIEAKFRKEIEARIRNADIGSSVIEYHFPPCWRGLSEFNQLIRELERAGWAPQIVGDAHDIFNIVRITL